MNNRLFRKGFIFGIALLFIVTTISPCISQKINGTTINVKDIITGDIRVAAQTDPVEICGVSPLDDSLDQYQIVWNRGIAIGSPDLLAQSFRPSENMLTRVKLLVSEIGNPLDNLSVSIRSSLNGTDLTSISVPPQVIPADKNWVEFDFPDVVVNTSQTYYIVFKPQGVDMSYLWWGYDNHNLDSYPDGEAWLYTSGNWSTDGFVVKDWCFKTYVRHASNPPCTPNIPSGPVLGITWASYLYFTNTTDPDGDDVRYGWDWDGDGIVDEWTGFYPSGMVVNMSHSWNTSGTYNLKVKAEDVYGAQSDFSSALTVDMLNDPPYTPNIPSGPVLGMTLISYLYFTNTTDPDGDDVRYGWDWDGDGIVDEWTGFYPSGMVVNMSHSWNTSGTYNLKVKAEDVYGAQSSLSSPREVVIVAIGNDPPDKPDTPTGPTFCKVGVSHSYSSSTTDPNGDYIYYMFDWDDGSTSKWVGPYSSGQTIYASHIWTAKGTYQIKVKAKDEHGEESVWSDALPISMPKNLKSIDLIGGRGCFQLLEHLLGFLLFN